MVNTLDMLAVQYLEFSPKLGDISAEAARAKLADAARLLPLTHVLVGWNLPDGLQSVCREEVKRIGAKFYRWHPLLTGDGVFVPLPQWQVVGADGESIPGFRGLPEFTFVCPNHPGARAAVLARLDGILLSGEYDGLFLDRIRFPSPAEDPANHLGCFCVYCQRAAAQLGIDLEQVRRYILAATQTAAGPVHLVQSLLRGGGGMLDSFLEFRVLSITSFLTEIVNRTRAANMEVGLDCFAPPLTRMVGQSLSDLGKLVDWIKIMTYAHTLAPAGMPYEILGLADWLVHWSGMTERNVLGFLGSEMGLRLPVSRDKLTNPGLSSLALQTAINQGVAASAAPVLAGIELVDLPGITHLSAAQIRKDLQMVRLTGAAGLALSWDLLEMPERYLELVSVFLKTTD